MSRAPWPQCTVVLALVVLAGCSPGGGPEAEGKARTTTGATTTSATPTELNEIPVNAISARPRRGYTSWPELQWAAAWVKWQEGMDVALEYAQELLADPARRARAQPGTRAGKRLASAIRFLDSCAADAMARGAPPTTRLESVAEETAETCKRVAGAVAAAKAAGFAERLSADATFAGDHLADATRAVRSFVPGLGDETDDLPLLDRPGRESKIQIRYTYAASRLKRQQVTVSCFAPADWRRKFGPGQSPGKIGGFVEAHGAVGRLAPVVATGSTG
jgi:hypothetical protein